MTLKTQRNRIIKSTLLALTAALLACCQLVTGADKNLPYSNIAPDEHVVLFRAAAHLSEDGQDWVVPLHAWVHEIEPRAVQKRTLALLLDWFYDIEIAPNQQPNFNRAAGLLFADSESNKRLVVQIGPRRYHLPETGRNGLTNKKITVPRAELAHTDEDFFTVSVIAPPGDKRQFSTHVLKEGANSRVVISDFDDTVKITGAMAKKTLYENTFANDYVAVEGMAELYREWADMNWKFHFVSSSPEQLYPLLDEFLERENFPPSVLHLKSFRFVDRSVGNLVRSALETKPPAIRDIMEACSRCTFVLIGDSGQEDPEVYTEILKDYPERILAVGIHNVTGDLATHPRYKTLQDELGSVRFGLFTNPQTIAHFGNLRSATEL